MNKRLLLTVILFSALYCLLPAQITLDQNDIPVIGDYYTIHRDSLATGITITPASATAQTWDFSNLVHHTTSERDYIDPASTPNAADFPNSNLAVDVNGLISYLQVDSNSLANIGLAGDPFGVGLLLSAPFAPAQKIYEVPSTFGTTFSEDYGLKTTVDGSVFMVDSIRVQRTGNVTSTMDAFGMITTPTGTYEAIREHKIETSLDSVWINIFSFETFFLEQRDTIETYTWIAKETKGPIVIVNIEDGLPDRATYTLAPSSTAPIADFSFVDQMGGEIDFRDQSNNVPDTWLWDFGDGNTSTDQYPTHTYADDGTYNVCLTVTNAFGSDMICQIINVSTLIVPIADFDFTISATQEDATVNFTDISANTPTAWFWDFGDDNSAIQNPMHTYTASGVYQVCLTASNGAGSDEVCKEVEINIIPTADFAIGDMGDGMFTFTDISTNLPTQWSWDLGDGTFTTDQNPQHSYASSGTYTVCLNAANSAGSDLICKEVIVQITSTQNLYDAVDVNVFPNPATDKVNLEIKNLATKEASVIFMDIIGQQLCQYPINNNVINEIPLNSWAKGLYFYHICTENGITIYRGSIIVE